MRKVVRAFVASAAVAAMVLPQSVVAQGAPGLPLGVLPGDGSLTCPQIMAEGKLREKEYDALVEAMDDIQMNPSGKEQALMALNGVLGSLFSFLPAPLASLAGSFGYKAMMDLALKDAGQGFGGIDGRQAFALERMSLMHGLYQRKCLGGLKDVAMATATPDPKIMRGLSGKTAPFVDTPDVVKAGDEALTCSQLNAEVASIEREQGAIKSEGGRADLNYAQKEADRMKAQAAAQTAIQALGAAVPGGSMAAAAAAKAAGAAMQIARDPVQAKINASKPLMDRAQYATERMKHVRGLYMDKCLGGNSPQ